MSVKRTTTADGVTGDAPRKPTVFLRRVTTDWTGTFVNGVDVELSDWINRKESRP